MKETREVVKDEIRLHMKTDEFIDLAYDLKTIIHLLNKHMNKIIKICDYADKIELGQSELTSRMVKEFWDTFKENHEEVKEDKEVTFYSDLPYDEVCEFIRNIKTLCLKISKGIDTKDMFDLLHKDMNTFVMTTNIWKGENTKSTIYVDGITINDVVDLLTNISAALEFMNDENYEDAGSVLNDSYAVIAKIKESL